MKVVILCGGKGTRLREKSEMLPKPMIVVGNRPILWHIMKIYSAFGFNEFILALGYKGEIIKQYFLNYRTMGEDFTLTLGENGSVTYHNNLHTENWKITFVNTGQDTMTGSRVARVAEYVDGSTFLLTYGDGLSNVNVNSLVEFHKRHGKIGTVTGVHSPSRFGKLVIDKENSCVGRFTEKPLESGISDYINGGFFVLNRDFFNYLDIDKSCILEREPLENLAKDGELVAYRHDGYWQCMDTYRDWLLLEDLSQSNEPPWKPIIQTK